MRSQAGLLQDKGLPCCAVLCRRCGLIRRDHRWFHAGIFWRDGIQQARMAQVLLREARLACQWRTAAVSSTVA